MKIAVYKTGHEIADTVANAVIKGLDKVHSVVDTDEHCFPTDADVIIGYGILRGMDRVFRACDRVGKPWFNIDKGYWKPGHFDGYYRVSLRGTQQTKLLGLEPDYARFEHLGVEILKEPPPYYRDRILICPATEHVQRWLSGSYALPNFEGEYRVRPKDSQIPLQQDLNACKQVVTFNSSVGWEALRQGIPVVSDAEHSIVGAYDKLMVDKAWQKDYDARRRLFGIMASLQMTLDEMRQGKLLPLLEKLLGS